MNLDAISSAIDKILDKPRWSKREHDFYNMLKNKVAKYNRTIDDRKEIMDNIRERPWYKGSNNQGTITTLIETLAVKECKYRNKYKYRLEITIGDALLIMAIKDGRFQLYYKKGGLKAHIAGHNQPDYSELKKIFPSIQPYETVCIGIETALYYDIDQYVQTLPLSAKSTITIVDLINKIETCLKC